MWPRPEEGTVHEVIREGVTSPHMLSVGSGSTNEPGNPDHEDCSGTHLDVFLFQICCPRPPPNNLWLKTTMETTSYRVRKDF